jgi:hypothetical protein
MKKVGAYKWSLMSFAITIFHVCLFFGLTQYLYRVRGIFIESTSYYVMLGWFQLIAILLGMLTAGISISIEHPRYVGGVALTLACLSFLLMVG